MFVALLLSTVSPAHATAAYICEEWDDHWVLADCTPDYDEACRCDCLTTETYDPYDGQLTSGLMCGQVGTPVGLSGGTGGTGDTGASACVFLTWECLGGYSTYYYYGDVVGDEDDDQRDNVNCGCATGGPVGAVPIGLAFGLAMARRRLR